MQWTQEKFLSRMEELYAQAVKISRAKNADYAGTTDPFKNFKQTEAYGVSVEQGILVRMSDKMTRISNLLTRDAQVKDESILDTLADLANYSIILRMWLEQKAELSTTK